MATLIDLNADLGEAIGDDRAMLEIVTSASIACGGHAGNEHTMRAAVQDALANSVRIGAHPGFEDPDNFGRRRLDLPFETIRDQVLAQIGRLITIAAEEGASVAYLKLHGALANMAAEDETLSQTIFAGVAQNHPGMAILALAASAQETAARRLGLPVIPEAYADRAYTRYGLLAARSHPGSVLEDTASIVAQCLRLAEHGEILAIDGSVFQSEARSICLHGDTPGALEHARAVRDALKSRGLM
ncbi:5-oxoprolinase subunit PxpA [Pelagibacterium halotolerans]|uniref:Lactam utilization protein LamB n=1 Tax=Pelagibacterium halotolerans (strain DSM 22347 / JCM 15775 / CGMCC 1.7692 / B2) TaxID=1082931 RepID=G4R9N3_PELHB|nr:5-oxoprolinase subunit PxpA [Pelagibacterium halotolerans]AEQ51440.1 lactam utilization protein LamB [Pelagibacterium halotolerans B2]QJR18716.1 LamB/YcsF family protein [Pelagibacterium halotolerans]SEA13586.1 UPF0271 protein [Pelagibacterium halotolerans]